MPRTVIVTTDPGQDQAVALLAMLGRPDAFAIRGLVATAGNIDLGHTEHNARQILQLAGRSDIPVFRGSPQPLARALVSAAHVHGPTGLDGCELPEPTADLADGSGADFIVRTLREEPPGSVTIVSLSPLTNLALALQRAPEIATRAAAIVMMAGAYFEVGNITPSAEFNVFVDPEAADIVFRSGIPITVLPLDVTHKLLATPDQLTRFRELGNRASAVVAAWLEYSQRFDLAKYGWPGAPLHAPCVPAQILAPSLFSGRDVNLSVELSGALTTGMTVVDYWRITDRPRNVHYITDGDSDGYFELLRSCISALP